MVEQAYVYILASSFQHLYIGITNNLQRRIAEHKAALDSKSFTARYKINKLIYTESYSQITTAINREKQLKNWSRIKKLRIIVAQNPTWRDLSEDWDKQTEPYSELC